MKTSIFRAVLVFAVCGAAAAAPENPFEAGMFAVPESRIDQLVAARLAALGIEPAAPCSDAVFLRRAFLDVLGVLPTADEARIFLRDADPGKRSALVDRLLAREEFADYWAMKWCDLLRVKSEFPINLWPNAVQAYHRWIRSSIAENVRFDAFARALLVSGGSNFRAPPANFHRAVESRTPEGVARTVALTFMGTRAETWPKERLAGMAAFFSRIGYKGTAEWKEEIVFFDRNKPAAEWGVFPDGARVRLPAERDPREVFADWLLAPGNPWFARAAANRVWSWLLGRGVVHEPDDIRPENPPANPELLAFLERELVTSGYDMKHLFRLILNSRTYQRSCVPRTATAAAEANFAYYPLRRLEAEVLIDALCGITGTTEQYWSPIPEPFTYVPSYNRTVQLADGSITSSFLEMFGRSPRDTGRETERNTRVSTAQRLHMLNSSHVQRKIRHGPAMQKLLSSGGDRGAAVERVYLTVLSRFPTDDERAAADAYMGMAVAVQREGLIDLVWALFNGAEFLHRH